MYDMVRISVFIKADLLDVSIPSCEAIKETILWENPARLYGLA